LGLNESKTQRDETLAEIFSAYFLKKKFNYPVIDWEEKTINNKDVDIVVSYKNQKLYCEVKSPGWEGELTRKEQLGERKALPKYDSGKARTYSYINPIRRCIEKAYPKFLKKTKNLLIIYDDFFVSPLDDEDQIENALYDNYGSFRDDKYYRLGGVLFLKCTFTNQFDYRYKFFKNNFAFNSYTINNR